MANDKLMIRPLGHLVSAMQRYGQQLYQAPQETIRGVEPDTWYSPLQPVKPIGPAGVEPRGFQYWAGQNLLWTPRADAEYSAADLKELARYPLASMAISNVKDTMSQASWQIQYRPEPGESRKAAMKRGLGDKDLLKLNKFFEKPDREHMWPEWLRPLLDDMLVIDAWTILIRRTYAGEIVELPVLRGESIVRYIDENGFTPMPPQPAYAQNWWGIPLVNLTTDQLVYKPRNIVPRNTIASQLYGMSPTEQLAPELEIGRDRLAFTAAYYKEGSIPGVVQVVPRGTPPEKISEAMQWMNSELAGNLAARRQWRMVQGFNEPGKPEQIMFTKEQLLADAYDEQHTRRVAYGYGISPQRLIKMIRTEGVASQEASDTEGLLPYFASLKSLIDFIIQYKFGYESYEMVLEPLVEPDQKKQSEVLTAYVKEGIIRRNEARERIGEDADPNPLANQLCITTGQGAIPLGETAMPAAPKEGEGKPSDKKGEEKLDAQGKPIKPNGGVPPDESKAAHAQAIGFIEPEIVPTLPKGLVTIEHSVEKRMHEPAAAPTVGIYPGRLAPDAILARLDLSTLCRKRFKLMRRKVTKSLAESLGVGHAHIAKASPVDAATQAAMDSLVKEWEYIADHAEEYLVNARRAGVSNGAVQLEITNEGMLDSINTVARDQARERAAELVGMRRTAEGKLIRNPSARWAITESTRNDIREIVTDALGREQVTLRDIEDALEAKGTFTDTRASLIANAEIARAQTQGNLLSWRMSGRVTEVGWRLSMDHDHDDECDDLAGAGPYKINEVPDCPAHPNCICALVIVAWAGEAEKLMKGWVTLDGRHVFIADDDFGKELLDNWSGPTNFESGRMKKVQDEAEAFVNGKGKTSTVGTRLVMAIQTSPTESRKLYRGLIINKKAAREELLGLKVGDEVSLTRPQGFSSSQRKAFEFASGAKDPKNQVIFKLAGDSKALDLNKIGGGFVKDKEFVTGGKFKVTGVESVTGVTFRDQYHVITIRQVSAYGKKL